MAPRDPSSVARGEAITTQRLPKLVPMAIDISGSANLAFRPHVVRLNSVTVGNDEVSKIVVTA
jgi:hypothetical protein